MVIRKGVRGSWGAYAQEGNLDELDTLGSRLSQEISCPVHYPAYGKNLFECICGVTFPLFLLKGGDWNKIREIHKKVLNYNENQSN